MMRQGGWQCFMLLPIDIWDVTIHCWLCFRVHLGLPIYIMSLRSPVSISVRGTLFSYFIFIIFYFFIV
jgi:hypothetical protein